MMLARFLALVLLALLSVRPASAEPEKGAAGHWLGTLHPTPVFDLRLALDLTAGADGKLTGTLRSLDQGGVPIPIASVSQDSGRVIVKLPAIAGSFEGTLSADGGELSGEWQQAGNKLPLIFKRQAVAASLKRPQEPTPPFPYREEPASVPVPTTEVTLSGTLTLPPGAGPHPVVVLITGSGPQDRDEALMGHRPFLVLADHLARAGLAVLRCDDRGVAKSTGKFGDAVHTDFVADTLAQVAWLEQRPEIDPRRIGLIGHSEGGLVAPLAAAEKPDDIAFLVLLAAPGIPMEDLLLRQAADVAKSMGVPQELIDRSVEAQRRLYAQLKTVADSAAAEKLARETIERDLAAYTPEQRKQLGVNDTSIQSQCKLASKPWFRLLLNYDPRPTLGRVRCPVLALNGEKDLQVAAEENLSAIQKAVKAGGNERVETKEFPAMNHLFQTSKTGAVSEYSQLDETFSPIALEYLASWLRRQTGL